MTRTMISTLLALGTTLVLAAVTDAGAAPQRVQAKACVQSARTERLACRTTCRADGEGGDCLRSCRQAYRGARDACQDICTDGCDGPGTSPACQGQCGMALGQCARGAAAEGSDCIESCPHGNTRGSCARECAAAAREATAACALEFMACVQDCRGGTSTTSSTVATTSTVVTTTSSTTFPPPPACESSTAPVCGGACPEVGQSCVEVEPGVCGCVGGSPSAAFVSGPAARR